jgi:hypothetical protein
MILKIDLRQILKNFLNLFVRYFVEVVWDPSWSYTPLTFKYVIHADLKVLLSY